jgi:hypothetical protein
LEVARINLERLVVCAADEVAMADVVRPGDVGIALTSEWVAFQARELSEIATEICRREGSEIAANGTLTFDHHEPFLLPLELVDLNGFLERVSTSIKVDIRLPRLTNRFSVVSLRICVDTLPKLPG